MLRKALMMNGETEDIGARIRALRNERGWSQRVLDQRAKLPHGYVSKLEKGRVASPSLSMLRRIAAAMDFPIERFLHPDNGEYDNLKSAGEKETDFTPATAVLAEMYADLAAIERLDSARLAALQVLIADARKQAEWENSARERLSH